MTNLPRKMAGSDQPDRKKIAADITKSRTIGQAGAVRAAGYVRFATTSPISNPCLHQTGAIRACATKNGFEVGRLYIDACVSGSPSARRPELLKLIDDARDGLVDVVLVTDADRLGRGTLAPVFALLELGVSVIDISLGRPIDINEVVVISHHGKATRSRRAAR